MAEYIERESFIENQRHLYCENCDRRRGMKDGKLTKRFVYAIGDAPCRACDIGDMLDSIEDYVPAADVAPVVRGKWERLDMHKGIEQFRCSICRSECYVPTCMGEPMYEFCPNCGARMEVEHD